jgi:hypothetical protein
MAQKAGCPIAGPGFSAAGPGHARWHLHDLPPNGRFFTQNPLRGNWARDWTRWPACTDGGGTHVTDSDSESLAAARRRAQCAASSSPGRRYCHDSDSGEPCCLDNILSIIAYQHWHSESATAFRVRLRATERQLEVPRRANSEPGSVCLRASESTSIEPYY